MTDERLRVEWEIHVITDDPDGSQRQAQIDAIARLLLRGFEMQQDQARETTREHPVPGQRQSD
jgi:hypothetical protein